MPSWVGPWLNAFGPQVMGYTAMACRAGRVV